MEEQNLDQLIKLGTRYETVHQVNNAAEAFNSALGFIHATLTPDQPVLLDDTTPGLVATLTKCEGQVFDTNQTTAEYTTPLQNLRHALSKLSKISKISAPYQRFVLGFKVRDTEDWIVVFHNRKKFLSQSSLDPSDSTIKDTVPCGESYSYLLHPRANPIELLTTQLSPTQAERLSYIYAHLADARVVGLIKLYSEHQILNTLGEKTILRAARGFRDAIALNPKHAWALAHLGETYRNLANGWPSDSKLLTESNIHTPASHYVTAMLYFQSALDQNESFWAHAHLGATIVNARSFAGFYKPDDTFGELVQLRHLIKKWFPNRQSEDIYQLLTEKAATSLYEAQVLLGNFYPWAQVYYAGTMLLKTASMGPDESEGSLSLLTMATMADAYSLQPELLTDTFEPGELYVNPYLQIGLLYFHLGKRDPNSDRAAWNYRAAWDYVRIGMGRLFNFHFIPGLQALLGFQLLAKIAKATLLPSPPTYDCGVPMCKTLHQEPSLPAPAGISIPSAPFSTNVKLFDFIKDVYERSFLPTLAPFTHADFNSNTKIQMGITQAFFVLADLFRILEDLLEAVKKETPADTTLCHKIKLLRQKMQGRIKHPFPSRMEKVTWLTVDLIQELGDYDHHTDDIFSFLNTGKPSINMITTIKSIQKTAVEADSP
ncbi:MAG: hypothetical protein AAGF11_41710 [Myxococcota bacterium]